jgi:hypothetical protein
MKIEAPTKASQTLAPKRASGFGGGGFTLPQIDAARGTNSAQATGAMSSLTGLDALMALQQFEEVGERRKRAARRANGLLETLDGLRVAMLSGATPAATAANLAALLNEHRDTVDDERLESLLDEIDLRAQVELAKLEQARG